MKNKGHWIETYTGKRFELPIPHPNSIDIRDIARGLAFECRFGGQTEKFYSVAQHSIMVYLHAPTKYKLTALMHDASEAYIKDIQAPLKDLLPNYKKVQEEVMRVIAEKYNFHYPLPPEVKEIDLRAMLTEKRDLLGKEPALWTKVGLAQPYDEKIDPFSTPKIAEKAFLREFMVITKSKFKEIFQPKWEL